MSTVHGKTKKKLNRVSSAKPQARWGKYWTWKITSDRLNPISSLSVSDEWEKVQKQKKTKKKGKKNGKTKTVTYHRRAAAEIKLSYELHREFFGKDANLLKHINRWKKRIGKTGAFYLDNRVLFSNKKWRLTGVDVSDIQAPAGAISKSAAQVQAATIELTFTEVKGSKSVATVYKGKSKKTSKKKSKKSSSKKGTAYRVTASALNFRKGPGTSNKVVRTKQRGTVVKIVATRGGWGKTSSGDWCSLSYLKKKG